MQKETFITEQDVLVNVKYHPHITNEEKKSFKRHLNLILKGRNVQPNLIKIKTRKKCQN